MVEKDEALRAVRALRGAETAARRAEGRTVRALRADLWRRERVAVLHRLRLKADILN